MYLIMILLNIELKIISRFNKKKKMILADMNFLPLKNV